MIKSRCNMPLVPALVSSSMTPLHSSCQYNWYEVQNDFSCSCYTTGTSIGITWCGCIVNDSIIFLNVQTVKMRCNTNFLSCDAIGFSINVRWYQWHHQWHMTLMQTPMLAFGTKKSYNTSKQSSSHNKCNGVIDGTINIIWQDSCYCHLQVKNYHVPQMLYIPHVPISSCTHVIELSQYICLLWIQCNCEGAECAIWVVGIWSYVNSFDNSDSPSIVEQ